MKGIIPFIAVLIAVPLGFLLIMLIIGYLFFAYLHWKGSQLEKRMNKKS